MTGGRRSAMVIANDTYEDPRLRSLRAPATDAAALAQVLQDGQVGAFEVEVSLNDPEHVVRRKLSAFFDDRAPEDLLLLHLSCHGIKDEDGRLHFATPDTAIDHLDATAVPADFVNRQMTRSRSRRIVLFLDCCYSGAFARGMLSRGDERMDLVERFEGRGRIVLTASSAMEYAFEGDHLTGKGRPSVFTSALVDGLATGEADLNRDGFVTVDELYDFAYDRVRAVTPSQTPGKWVFDVQGDFYLARSSRPPEPVDPLADLRAAIASPFTNVRLGAVEELAALLDDPDQARADLAREVLATLARDDRDPLVRSSAQRAGGTVTVPVHERVRQVITEPPLPRWIPATTRSAAVALLAALPLPLMASTPDGWNILAVVGPLEIVVAALVLLGAPILIKRRQLSVAGAAGVFLAVGMLAIAVGFGLVKFSSERVGGPAVVLSVIVVLGGIAAVVAGATCAKASAGSPAAGRVESVWLMVALVGAGLVGVALFVPYDGYSSLWTEVEEISSAEFFFEPAVAVACLLLGATMLPSRRALGAALLITTGLLTACHFLGLLVAAMRAIGEVGEVRSAGWIGLVGGVLSTVAGWQTYRSQPALSDHSPE
jgi:hypothetical protein